MRKGAYRSRQQRTIDTSDKASTEWLDSLKTITKSGYLFNWIKFLEFTGTTGDQILADRKAGTWSYVCRAAKSLSATSINA